MHVSALGADASDRLDVFERRVRADPAVDLADFLLPPDHPQLASALVNLGVTLDEIGRHDEARPLLERALAPAG